MENLKLRSPVEYIGNEAMLKLARAYHATRHLRLFFDCSLGILLPSGGAVNIGAATGWRSFMAAGSRPESPTWRTRESPD